MNQDQQLRVSILGNGSGDIALTAAQQAAPSRNILLAKHLAAMNSLSDFVSKPCPETEQAMRQAEGEFRADLLEAFAQREKPALTINGYQLRGALEFLAPDGTGEQLEQEVCIQHGPERTHDEGTDPVGLYCWLSEYPDEGSIPLLGEAGEQPAASKPDYRRVTPIRQPGEPS